MAVSVLSVARTLGRLSGWALSNLELQKMSYMAEMIHLGRSGGVPLIREDFEAWDNGPVVPLLYHAVKSFGAEPVRDVFLVPFMQPDDADFPAVQAGYDLLKDKSPGEMVATTHWRDGAWARRYRPGARGVVIPKSLILEEYRARTDD
ncbi:MAG: putative phage-associated protein [Sphingomonas bacterium]|jgi:uncharacterized phage-associated protein|nr:putative phage-associated protein [Sphingomonas bacterium]MDB5717342.1 putative phage-associated protein [Sphingomonas bacterium]